GAPRPPLPSPLRLPLTGDVRSSGGVRCCGGEWLTEQAGADKASGGAAPASSGSANPAPAGAASADPSPAGGTTAAPAGEIRPPRQTQDVEPGHCKEVPLPYGQRQNPQELHASKEEAVIFKDWLHP
ncbi:unnamed protein product, partial [Urochloa humidicola]